jgi:hypothetical protein
VNNSSDRRWSRYARAVSAIALTACATGSGLGGAGSSSGPRTRAERTNYLETSHYADVVAFLDSLKGRPELVFGSIGKTNEGREIPYVIASRPAVSTPDEARRLARPIVYVQGNIHAGEVEGKEALLAVLRDLTSSSRRNALDSIVLIAVPIYNADGNEKFAPQETNRGSQNGPAMVGVRTNAQGLDLNRDYMKAEAPETRASLAMFTKWDPEIFVDLHTTDGSYHGYALTYAPPLNPAAQLGVWARDSIMPVLRQRMQSRRGFPTFDYGDFISDDTLSKGWVTFDSRPRYGTNYYGLRGRIGILSEAFSHDPFERRVKSTYAFVQEILSLAAERGARIREATALAASLQSAGASVGVDERSRLNREIATVLGAIPIRSEMVSAPVPVGVISEVVERTGDSTRTEVGVPMGRRRTGRFLTVTMPVFDRFNPTLAVPRPTRYVLAPADTAAVRVLRDHGIAVTGVSQSSGAADAMAGQGYVFVIDSTVVAVRPFQGHREMRLTGTWRRESRRLMPGSFIVDTAQPLGQLAIYLIEPQSDDGLVTWNYFDRQLQPGGTYPVFRIGGAPPTP